MTHRSPGMMRNQLLWERLRPRRSRTLAARRSRLKPLPQGFLALALCAGCAATPAPVADSAPSSVPVDPWSVPEPVPRAEARSRYGNPESYVVFGQRYHVRDSAEGYRDRGIASWYGTKFHGKRTSSGEPYDMFAISAAHKTLPLPSYVRVKNLENGRSLVVRVNDRGPFHPGRIIDLSYTAAVRLGVYDKGSARVEVTALTPGAPAPKANPPGIEDDALNRLVASLEARAAEREPPARLPFIQLGAFRNMEDCLRLESELARHKLLALQVQSRPEAGDGACRVLQGPFATREDADTQAQALRDLGYKPLISYP